LLNLPIERTSSSNVHQLSIKRIKSMFRLTLQGTSYSYSVQTSQILHALKVCTQ
jgi:hypothetical protein